MPSSMLSLKSRILVLYVISSKQKPRFWSKSFCLLPLELYLEFCHMLNFIPNPLLFLGSCERTMYPSAVNATVNRKFSGNNMLVSKSASITYSYGTLGKFLHVGESSLLEEVWTSIATLKSNFVLSCKVEYLHSLQTSGSSLMYILRDMHKNVHTLHSCSTNVPWDLRWTNI